MALATDFAKEFENYKKRCLELEEKSKQDETRQMMLEIELEDLKKRNRELEGKITNIQKVVNGGENVKGVINDVVDEEQEDDVLLELLIENNVLECEKQKAEAELCSCKEKIKELVSRVCELGAYIKAIDERVNEDVDMVSRGSKQESCSKVRKRLQFKEDECPNKKMAPSTPCVAKSPFHGVIDISDEDVCYNEIPKDEKNNLENNNGEHIDEELMEENFKVHSSNSGIAKRKRAAKIITSDDETSDDDNVLICSFKKQHSSRLKTDSEDDNTENARTRPITRLRKSESKNIQDKSGFGWNGTVCLYGNSSSDDEEDNDGIEEGSESEGESLGGIIADSSESISESASRSVDNCEESKDVLNEYKATLEKIGRKKVSNQKWDLEGDMLADFAKDVELCMRAVCALYRQQTADEKALKETIHHNARGFSQTDALRASKLAEFLTDGDSNGDLNKTVEELKQYDSKGIKQCTELATKYSKQLFKIYQNKEDPYFLPQ